MTPKDTCIACNDTLRGGELSLCFHCRTERQDAAWNSDKPDAYTERIDAAHPTKTKDHARYQLAMELVGV